MTEYINKDFYKQLPMNERHFINLNSANADEMIRQLKAAGIEFSATLGNYRRAVTVRKSDSDRADAILNSIAKSQSQQNNSRIIGNTEYRYIADKKYINTDTKTAMQIANLLSGDTSCRFSGRIVGDKATITVSGDKNAAVIRRMIENLKNTDIIEALREAGYERIPDTNGFVNIKNTETGVVCGFDGMDMVRDMFNDPENEFFHPTAYRIELTTDAFAEPYYIAEYDVRSGEEKSAYYDSNGISPVFVTLDDAVSYTEKNKIAVTNTEAELNEWRAAERDREDAAIVMANNQLIQQFPMQDGNYPDDFIFNPDSGNYSWVFFNPDGNEGNGEFCEKTITPQDIYEAYTKRISAANEKDGRNAFVDHLFAASEESTIETGSGYFLDYADDYISKSDNTVRFYGIYANGNENDISAFIKYLEDNCADVVKDKGNRQNTINEQSDEILVDGYKGTWYVIDSQIIDGKNYFLLESENYGDEAAGIIVDENRNVIMDDVWNGFLDYHEKFDNITPEEKLADKAEAEWNAFLENMKKKSPDMLIESAYEISTKKNIQAYITKEKLDLTNEQINALISSKNILSELYDEWLDNEYLSSYSDVKDLLNLTANKISASIERVSTVNDISELDKAKKYIENFLDSEYSSEADFSDMQHIAIGYTEIGSEEQGNHSLQMEADLEHFAVSYYIDDELVKTEKYDSLEQMNREHLSVLSFEDMLNIGTTELDRILEEKERNAANTELKDTDEIAKSLDLENNTITFSVVTIEGEKPFVIGSYIDKDDITDLEEYQDYIYDTGRKNIDVTVDYYTIGMGDNESYGADTDEKDYISEHLDEVLKYEYTDKLESETYFIDTPAELLEEISGEAEEKNYLFEAKNNKSQALIVNIYGGPGAGKSTTALQLAAELKKRGYNAEYVSEVAKDYVYGKRFDILDGSLAHQKQIFAEQKHRVDLMIGNVDIAITDAPLTLNTIYLNPNEKTPEYKNYILSEYNRYNNYNIYIERDLSAKFEQEGRIHNFAESIEKDTEIKSMLIDNNIPFDVCRRDNIAEIADKVSAKIEQHEPQKQKSSTYEIYQIPSGARYRDIRFANYEQLDLMGQLPDNMNYEQVYSGNLDEIEGDNKLEGLFIKFNFRRPDDFKGHSLSVSDVVVINDENGKTAHYVDDMGFRDITDIFLEREQDTQQKEVPLTVGVIEKYGLEIDFKEIDRIILRTENEQYEGGYDSEGHERKDNFSHSTTDVSIHYSENDYSLMREDDNEDAILIGRDHIAITIDAALTEIQNFLDESFDDRDKSVYIKYDDGRTQYINAEKLLEAARAERTAEPIRRKSGSEIEVGDRFLYNDREYTVTSEKGIYPYEVGVSYEEKTGDISYEVTSNINRYKLAENGVFLGNPEKESEKNEQTQEISSDTIITQRDIDILQKLPPRKSILNFSDEERKLTSKWAERYKSDIAKKSPYYRAENGDWRADETTRVPIIEMENKNISFGQIKDEVKNGTIERGNIINSDTNWNINISRKGLEDTIRYADKHNNNTSYNLLENVNAILKNSVLLDSQISDDNKNNKANSTGIMHKFYSVVRIGTEPYIAKSTVEEFFNGNMKNPDTLKRFYNLQDIKIEPLKNISFTENQLHSANFNGSDISISDLFKIVKSCDKDFYTNTPENNSLQKTQENSPVGNNYEPKINDVVSIDDTAYRITNISSNIIFLRENDTLIPEEKRMTAAEFMASGFEVIEENGEPTIKFEPTAAQTETHNFVISDDDYGVSGGAKTRYADNVAAIKTLKTIESEHRTATSEEQNILSKYTGWGAIPQAFDINNDKWRTEYAELRTLLTPDEYTAARRSTLNAHYTSPTVISAIYDGLKNLGFESGKILEPAMGTGNFFGAMPKDMRSSKLYGVELDDLTGRIAQQLYPDADIQIKGFEQTAFADNSFDVAIGNVPFGDYKVNDRRYNDNNFLIHDYFFSKALDKVHPGGVVAFVTSKGTLDKDNPEVRKYIAQRAELLGAIRLPNNAFKANAGTEVTSDIIFLQKRKRPIEISDETEWLKKSETADGLSVNNYFVQHPEMVLGKIVEGNKMYGNQSNDTMCIPVEGADLKEQLSEAVKNIHGTFRAAEIETVPQNVDEIPAPAESRKYAYYAVDGNLYYREAEDTMKKVSVSNDVLNRAIGMIELRDKVHELLNLQLNNADGTLDRAIAESRKNLNNAYDSFAAKYGNVSDRKNAKAMQGDSGYNIVSALEVKNEKGKVTGKADIFTRNTVKPKIIAEHVETAEEALILSVSEKGKVDFEFMTELCGIDKNKLISELSGQIYRLPQEEEKYVTADEYLTGNIRKKIAELENAPDDMDITENKKALEAAMPPRVEAKDISVKLGAHWVDPKYIKQFILEKFKPDFNTRMDLDVQYSSVAGAWKLEGVSNTAKGGYEVRQTYGTKRKNAYEILEGILNNSDLLVKDRKKDENGIEIRDSKGNYILVTNDEETKAVRHCANLIKSEFRDWIFKDPDRREALVDKYNEVYNSIRQREYDGAHLNFVGMNTDIKLKDHQKNAVARALYGGNTLLAHAVGAGKTFEMIAIAMEGKRLGMHNKALFAVPNSLTEQMGNDFRKLYPNANILVATQKDFDRKNRMQLLGKIAANDWDAVIVGHSQFDRMGLSPEREKAYLTAEIDKLREELENAGAEKSFTVKQIEKTLTKYEDKLQKINDGQVKDDFIDFEQLGFDKLFVDESHMYKNLATPTKMKNVSGLGSQGSARAFGLLMKGKYLDELTGGKGMVFASGTPIITSYPLKIPKFTVGENFISDGFFCQKQK